MRKDKNEVICQSPITNRISHHSLQIVQLKNKDLKKNVHCHNDLINMLCVDMELFFVLVSLFGLCASLEISFLSEIFWTEKVRGVSDPVQCNNRLMLKEETMIL